MSVLKQEQTFSKSMFMCMKKYGGIGLTCNQVGIPFRMFVMGNHLSLKMAKNFLVGILK